MCCSGCDGGGGEFLTNTLYLLPSSHLMYQSVLCIPPLSPFLRLCSNKYVLFSCVLSIASKHLAIKEFHSTISQENGDLVSLHPQHLDYSSPDREDLLQSDGSSLNGDT